MQRALNGGGRIEREHGLGWRRVDLFVRWQRPQAEEQRFVTGCRILRGGSGAPPEKSLPQPAGYMDVCAAIAGYLAIFNRSTKPWREECSGGARCSSASLVSGDREENGRDREPRRTAVADLPAEDAPQGDVPAQAHECPT